LMEKGNYTLKAGKGKLHTKGMTNPNPPRLPMEMVHCRAKGCLKP
jgi:hypothetical protein